MEQSDRKSVASERVKAGSRTYFLDLRQSARGVRYLVITESRIEQDHSRTRESVMIFEDHLGEFFSGLDRICKAAGGRT